MVVHQEQETGRGRVNFLRQRSAERPSPAAGPRPDFYDVAAERLIEHGLDAEKVRLAMDLLRAEDAEEEAPRELPAPVPTLWNDPRGATCPVVPFFRHRAYRLMRPICMLGMPLALLFAGGVGNLEGAYTALAGCAGLLGVIVTSLVVPAQHARLAAVRRHARRLAGKLRFLCPGCLRFGPLQHACGACGKELEDFVTLTDGIYLNDCPHCHAQVFSRRGRRGRPPLARCGRCGEACDETHHERRVRVIGTLDAGDVHRLSEACPDPREVGGQERACVIDDGATLTYVLDVAAAARARGPDDPAAAAKARAVWTAPDLSGLIMRIAAAVRARELDESEAASSADALWISGAAADPLVLGQALDEYLRRTGDRWTASPWLVILVEASSLDPVAQSILETRCDDVRYRVSAAAALKA